MKIVKKILLIFFLVIISFIESYSQAYLERKAYYFDAGSSISKTGEGSIQLTKENLYNKNTGYGWTIKPALEFVRERLSKYRNDFTVDGLTGKQLSFAADIPSGEWYITIWIESGIEDSSTTEIKINDHLQELNWQTFSPGSEPRTQIQKMYRIFSGSFSLINRQLELSMESKLDSIRLLGFSLIPKEAKSESNKKLFSELEAAGKYNSNIGLKNVRERIEKIFIENREDNFIHHFKEQLDLLIEAESLLDMMGWEWATIKTNLGLFDRYFQAVMIFDALVNQKDSPFYERTLWLRSKLLYWLDLERGVEHEGAVSSKGLKQLFKLYPDDQILAMYNGKKVDTPDKCDSIKISEDAPLWSKLQYEALCRLQNEIDWWVNVRQAPNGELGGKLGDDVEILRGWHPAILSGDQTSLRGWEKLADCVWESPQIYKGYARDADDVEHSSEFISDTTPELFFFTDDEKYVDRLKYSVDYFKNLWTGIAQNGKRYFKSAWFSSTVVDTTPPKNRDLEMNTRAAKAIRYYAWKTGDQELIDQLQQWSLGWVDAALRNDKGKPVGIIPASIVFPSLEINGDEENWYTANMYWGYFNWRHAAGTKMIDQLLFTYLLTGDSLLLQPLFLSLQLFKKYENKNPTINIKVGSEEWAVSILKRKKEFWNTVEQYRFITSDKKYDDLILKYGTPYSKYRLTGDIKFIEDALENYLENIRFNSPLRTTEVLHTDRVYYRGTEYIKAMLTGDGTSEGMSPYYSVSWENTNSHLTALVDETGDNKLSIRVFSHSPEEMQIMMRVWQLEKGNYILELKDDEGIIESTSLNILHRGERIQLKVPSKKLVYINIIPDKKS